MTDILVDNAFEADDLVEEDINDEEEDFNDDEEEEEEEPTREFRKINVNATVSELLTFAFNRIKAVHEEDPNRNSITFTLTRQMYDKYIWGIRPETHEKVHDRFVNYLTEKGFDVEDELDVDSDGHVNKNVVIVRWGD